MAPTVMLRSSALLEETPASDRMSVPTSRALKRGIRESDALIVIENGTVAANASTTVEIHSIETSVKLIGRCKSSATSTFMPKHGAGGKDEPVCLRDGKSAFLASADAVEISARSAAGVRITAGTEGPTEAVETRGVGLDKSGVIGGLEVRVARYGILGRERMLTLKGSMFCPSLISEGSCPTACLVWAPSLWACREQRWHSFCMPSPCRSLLDAAYTMRGLHVSVFVSMGIPLTAAGLNGRRLRRGEVGEN